MNASLTVENKRLVKALLRVGRWANESEIVRYGLHLVAREVEAERQLSLEPISAGVLARAYRKLGREHLLEDRAMSAASARPRPGEMDA
jgi:Arc/MetJ-type ribon-helix-helix transcriptional regulator